MLVPVWVTASFFLAQILVGVGLYGLTSTGLIGATFDDPITSTLIAVAVYVTTLALVVFVPHRLFGRARVSRRILGLTRLPNWLDILLTPAAAVIYLLTTALIVSLFSWLFPSVDLQQVQEVGFDNLSARSDYILAFITLIIIAPLAEELLFRGYVYGKLRIAGGFIPAVLMTSLLFGVAHLQWNVAIDTFALGLVLCGLREITGSIWAGVLLHMLKNGVAFYFIFINPSLLSTLGG